MMLALALSGCLGDGSTSAGPRETPTGSSESSSSPTPTTPTPGKTTTPRPTPSTSPAPTPTKGPVPQTPQNPWPALASATIRPGVATTSPAGQCTSNFLYRSPNNATLYLGSAAHCFDGRKVGDTVTIEGASKPGRLAYSSWITRGLTNCLGEGGLSAGGECDHDFALVSIDAADRPKVHPAVLHFGGPTALTDSTKLAVGARILVPGNSGTWPPVDEVRWHEGVVAASHSSTDPQFEIVTVAPGIPGDSGSAVMTRAGEAAGILATLCFAPCTGQNGVVGLKGQLEFAKTKGTDVLLVTWSTLDDGIIP